jgi:hypothetical protein
LPNDDNGVAGGRLAILEGELPGENWKREPQQQESTMKKFILAAAAVLSLGAGSAFAAQTVINSHGQVMWGPAYSNDVAGG